MFVCIIFVKKQNPSLQVDNDEDRKVAQLRLQIREMIAQKNMSDEQLHAIICVCANNGWVEELRLTVNVPRSWVECCHILIVFGCMM